MPPRPNRNHNSAAPYWSMKEASLYLGDVRKCLAQLPSRSVHCCVTSPPYWGLRDYGVCMCTAMRPQQSERDPSKLVGSGNVTYGGDSDPDCRLCNGTGRTIGRSDQIGCESSPDCGTWGQAHCGDCFTCSMVSVCDELKRVLRDDGVFWLNLGDTYASNKPIGLRQGNLIGVPWRVAFALQHSGWILRQDVIWAKPNPMTESVTDRCTKAHEYIFILTKSDSYYFDRIAIARKTVPAERKTVSPSSFSARQAISLGLKPSGNGVIGKSIKTDDLANKHSVWIESTKPGADGHFATFSKELITPCILSSTSEYGCCVSCGKPYERVTVKTEQTRQTIGWRKMCKCSTSEVKPCTVLDPFVGSGTTVVASIDQGRHAIGIDVCKAYLDEHAVPRIRACIVGGSGIVKRQNAVVEEREVGGLDPGSVPGL